MEEKYIIISIIIGILIISIIIISFKSFKQEKFEEQPNITTSSVPKPTLSDIISPSYWYNYLKSDSRSKCFDCDNTSKLAHGSNCYDCEIEGGRKVDTLLNRVLTR